MFDFFRRLFGTSSYPARWNCGEWTAGEGWLHILSELATFSAYVAIPLTIIWYVRRRRDVAFPRLFWLFAGFIFACGSVHLVEAIIFWQPVYRLSGLLKLVTAIFSLATVVAVVRLAPAALRLPNVMAINAQLRAEVERRQKVEERLTAILDNMSDGVLVSDPTGNLELMNPSAISTFRFTEEDKDYEERFKRFKLIGNDGAALTGDALPLRRAGNGERIDDLELTISCPTRGVDSTIRLSARPIMAGGETPAGAVAVFRDITELKSIEEDRSLQLLRLERITSSGMRVTEALQESTGQESLLKVIADIFHCRQITLVICQDSGLAKLVTMQFDPTGKVAARDHSMIPRENFGDVPCEELEDVAVVVPEMMIDKFVHRNAAIGGLPLDGVIKGVVIVSQREEAFSEDDLDLLFRVARLISAAVFTKERVAQEQAARKEAEANLISSLKKLERLNRTNLVGEMTAGIAHELNQPLTALINYTDEACRVAQQEFHSDEAGVLEELRDLTRRSNEQAIRSAEVLRSVRRLIRQEPPSYCSVELNQLLQDTAQLLQSEVADVGASIDVRHAASRVVVEADHTQLEQVIVNLIRNAIQAVNSSSRKNISLAAGIAADRVLISVTDTGRGLTAEEQAKTFDAFFSKHSKGLGLGLKICRSIVELHGGHIHAENNPAGGAVFTVELPISQTHTEARS